MSPLERRRPKRAMSKQALSASDGSPLIEETRELLASFWNEPTKREAQLLTGLRFESDEAGSVIGPVVRPYSLGELLGRDPVPRVWREASLRLTSALLRPIVRLYFRLRSSSR